jgi:hypothetical protein
MLAPWPRCAALAYMLWSYRRTHDYRVVRPVSPPKISFINDARGATGAFPSYKVLRRSAEAGARALGGNASTALALSSSGRPSACFARFRSPLVSNVDMACLCQEAPLAARLRRCNLILADDSRPGGGGNQRAEYDPLSALWRDGERTLMAASERPPETALFR